MKVDMELTTDKAAAAVELLIEMAQFGFKTTDIQQILVAARLFFRDYTHVTGCSTEFHNRYAEDIAYDLRRRFNASGGAQHVLLAAEEFLRMVGGSEPFTKKVTIWDGLGRQDRIKERIRKENIANRRHP